MNLSADPRLQLFLRLMDSAPILVWALDRDGRYTMTDGRGLAGLGTTPGEWVGRDALADWKGTAAEDSIRRALAGEEFKTSVTVPGPRHYDVWWLPIRDEETRPNGCYGLALDLTAEREREAELCARLEMVKTQQSTI